MGADDAKGAVMGGASGKADEPIVVAIDGPAGSGKSSVATAVAQELGYGKLDTGAGYRSLTWAALDADIDLDNEAAVHKFMSEWQEKVHLSLDTDPKITYDAADITQAIRDPQITKNVRRISKHPAVRERINAIFRQWVRSSGLPGVVIEGRDITTVVMPNAQVRLILTADAAVRAERRHRELPGMTLAEVASDLAARDAVDLKVVNFIDPAPGVTLVDTSDLDFAGSVAAVIAEVNRITA